MRGRIDLGTHKLANVFRAPAERRKWKRARREKCPDEQYRQLWDLVAGAVRDTFAVHPEYLTEAGQRAAERSITKRVTGTLYGYATQVARGRSIGVQDVARDLAAIGPTPLLDGGGWRMRFCSLAASLARAVDACRGSASKRSPKFSGPQDG